MGPRARLIARIAPVAPPCFESRLQWVAYLSSAAEGQKPSTLYENTDSLVLIRTDADGYRINPQFAFCRDCTARHSHAMLTAGKCQPGHLLNLQAAPALEESHAS